MPLPKQRCIANLVVTKEYPSATQRYAVYHSSYKEKKAS